LKGRRSRPDSSEKLFVKADGMRTLYPKKARSKAKAAFVGVLRKNDNREEVLLKAFGQRFDATTKEGAMSSPLGDL